MSDKPPLPPFTLETAIQKARIAEDAWNSRDPQRVALAYTLDSQWRNRTEFPKGRDEIVLFLTGKWQREQDYRLIKEVWVFRGNRIGFAKVIQQIELGSHPNSNLKFSNAWMREYFDEINHLCGERLWQSLASRVIASGSRAGVVND